MPKTVTELLAQNGIKSDESLMHYGIPGMRWGKRKGSSSSSSSTSASKPVARKLSEIPDDELKTMIGRLKLEKEFLTLTAPPPKQVSKGRKIVTDLLLDVGKTNAKNYLTTGNKPPIVEQILAARNAANVKVKVDTSRLAIER